MQTYLVSFIASTLASALFTPVARIVSFNFGIVSRPGGRHVHGRSIARFGGLGIFLAFESVDEFTYERRGDTNVNVFVVTRKTQ